MKLNRDKQNTTLSEHIFVNRKGTKGKTLIYKPPHRELSIKQL